MKMFSTAFVSSFFFLLLFIMRRLISLHLQRLFIRRTTAINEVLSPPKASTHELLMSRALANERLIKAFALSNTFVSSDVGVHTVFVERAKSLIRAATNGGWDDFQNIAMEAVEAALPHAGMRDFDGFVQDVTMRVALVAILKVDTSVKDLDPEDIRVVSTLINQLWSLSKKPDPIPTHDLHRLNYHLRHLIPDDDSYPNPLDFVIPIWETMWRVVATSVAYARNSSHALTQLHRSPNKDQFRCFDTHPSAEWFVTEVMRLHPPSKHITRAFRIHVFPAFLPLSFDKLATKLFGPLLRRESADIGKTLRSESTWGVNACEFDPLRFHPNRVTRDQEEIKLLPFGFGRYRCVAAGWAPMAAGIISAAILHRIQSGPEFQLVAGESIGGREGWDGWSIVAQTDSESM